MGGRICVELVVLNAIALISESTAPAGKRDKRQKVEGKRACKKEKGINCKI
jgi:hypothetical protein